MSLKFILLLHFSVKYIFQYALCSYKIVVLLIGNPLIKAAGCFQLKNESYKKYKKIMEDKSFD